MITLLLIFVSISFVSFLGALGAIGGVAGGGGLGGMGPVGGGGAANSKSGDITHGPVETAVSITSGAGLRGYVNQPVFPGATLITEDSINPPITGTAGLTRCLPYMALGLLGLLVVIKLLRKG